MRIQDLIVPEEIAARPLALFQNCLDETDRFGRLHIVFSTDDNSRLLCKFLETRLREFLIECRVNDTLRLRVAATPCDAHGDRQNEHENCRLLPKSTHYFPSICAPEIIYRRSCPALGQMDL